MSTSKSLYVTNIKLVVRHRKRWVCFSKPDVEQVKSTPNLPALFIVNNVSSTFNIIIIASARVVEIQQTAHNSSKKVEAPTWTT